MLRASKSSSSTNSLCGDSPLDRKKKLLASPQRPAWNSSTSKHQLNSKIPYKLQKSQTIEQTKVIKKAPGKVPTTPKCTNQTNKYFLNIDIPKEAVREENLISSIKTSQSHEELKKIPIKYYGGDQNFTRLPVTPKRRVFSLASSSVSSHSTTFSPLNCLNSCNTASEQLIFASFSNPVPSATSLVLAQKYESVLTKRNLSDRELKDSLKIIRKMILQDGIPTLLMEKENMAVCTLRGKIWKILLGVYKVNAKEYTDLVEKKESENFDKIKNDCFRTLKTDKNFLFKVDFDMISRVLNAFVWKTKNQPVSRLINLKYSYVQGMNVLAAPFLYVMPELDAFYSFTNFIQSNCPLYVQPALEGLLDKCLKVVDLELYKYLKNKKLNASIYAFPSIMTFSACTSPLSEVLKIWDFLLAYGFHLNILCVISQLILIRDKILVSDSPMKILRTLPDLNAKLILRVTLNLIPQLSEDLYDMLVRHLFDPMIYDVIINDSKE
ncbi:hypothetical protein HDU92_006625 [Lobulomyces angularis]|nr:hypothetical protein HDU92_006625 [Lobulomyces angularis]